jgi:hypothetical protein
MSVREEAQRRWRLRIYHTPTTETDRSLVSRTLEPIVYERSLLASERARLLMRV